MPSRTNVWQIFRGKAQVLLVALTVLAVAASSQTSSETVLVVKGALKQELHLTAADLKAMTRVKVSAKDHDGVAREYEGVTLQALLAKAGAPLGGDLRRKNMTLVVVAEGGEAIAPSFRSPNWMLTLRTPR